MPSRIAASVPPCARTMPAARLLAPAAEGGGLDEHDGKAGLGEQARRPGADRPAADDHASTLVTLLTLA